MSRFSALPVYRLAPACAHDITRDLGDDDADYGERFRCAACGAVVTYRHHSDRLAARFPEAWKAGEYGLPNTYPAGSEAFAAFEAGDVVGRQYRAMTWG